MKKIRFAAVILLVSLMLCLCGCGGERTALTPDEFMDKMVEQGYNIYDISAQLVQYEDIETVYVATTGDELYQIEFYQLVNDVCAEALLTGNKVMFKAAIDGDPAAEEYEYAKGTYSVYKLTANGRYMVVARIYDTMIYVDASSEFKAEIDAAIKALGY